ncbi:MAG: 16S rRNA (cytosine(1402)-N(4))-methyltransferase RsmH [Candidatus Doudnabacteria bacterium]|nr:16S rRNA (cytosine(1402)-N(4))-methyltransferase RsmH [Candidatus Doudnabacteria bacterium]
MYHIPVLLDEVVKQILATSPGNVVDGTVGGGGYLKAVLDKNKQAKVLGIDLDQDALHKLEQELAQSNLNQRAELVHGNYSDLKEIVRKFGFTPVRAVVLDLGFSSLQLDDPQRGFSFQSTGPLDMRFDRFQKLTAELVVNNYPQRQLEEIFRIYGEEKFARAIAKQIVRVREIQKIQTTAQLSENIQQALPARIRHKSSDSARRIFQAIRIEVNKELDNLRKFLTAAVEILDPGGRILIVSFHSLEDRIVKEFFKKGAQACTCPPEFPECVCGKRAELKIITKKPIRADQSEIEKNPRSRPAKLRVAEKI